MLVLGTSARPIQTNRDYSNWFAWTRGRRIPDLTVLRTRIETRVPIYFQPKFVLGWNAVVWIAPPGLRSLWTRPLVAHMPLYTQIVPSLCATIPP
jgi:hypothetical protein